MIKNNPIRSIVVVSLFVLILAISSWLLFHILAVLGIFLALAYPFWWIIYPKQTLCFYCRLRKVGTCCPLCGCEVEEDTSIYPKRFSSAIANSLIILLISLFSIGLVYAEGRIIFNLGFPVTPRTVSFLIPNKGQYRLGEIIPLKIEIAGIKTPINTVQADLGFDPEKLEVKDISTQNSLANIFIQKEINNENGYARLTGGLPNPGYAQTYGLFGTVYFVAKQPGPVRVEFLPTSKVLANDGRGSDVLKEFSSVSYLILPERISGEEEQSQAQGLGSGGVLGEQTGEAQLRFFEDNKVLGDSNLKQELPKEDHKENKPDYLGWIKRIDQAILNFWSGAYRAIGFETHGNKQ